LVGNDHRLIDALGCACDVGLLGLNLCQDQKRVALLLFVGEAAAHA